MGWRDGGVEKRRDEVEDRGQEILVEGDLRGGGGVEMEHEDVLRQSEASRDTKYTLYSYSGHTGTLG